MSEVLTRSLITGLSSVFLVGVLLIFGGATLQDFAFAMMVGIVSGTYSSIFIASPVLTAWKEREPGFSAPPRADRRGSRAPCRPSPTRSRWRKLERRRRDRGRDRGGGGARSARHSRSAGAGGDGRAARPTSDGGEPSSNGGAAGGDPARAGAGASATSGAKRSAAASSAANTGGTG